jgi:WD40 repeat protein
MTRWWPPARSTDRAGVLGQRRLRHEMHGHTGNILSLAWIDNTRFVTSSVDGTLRQWDAASGACLAVTDLGVRSDCVDIAPDGRILAGDDAGRIAVISGGETIFVPAHEAGIKKLVLARDGARLVTLGYDRALAVWDLAPGQPRARSPAKPCPRRSGPARRRSVPTGGSRWAPSAAAGRASIPTAPSGIWRAWKRARRSMR